MGAGTLRGKLFKKNNIKKKQKHFVSIKNIVVILIRNANNWNKTVWDYLSHGPEKD